MNRKIKAFLFLSMLMVIAGCKSGPFNVFKPSSPHEAYKRKLESSGLANSVMGRQWIELSQSVIRSPVPITVPYRETGYFAASEVNAAAFSFNMVKGQKLTVKLNTKPSETFRLYSDIWETGSRNEPDLIGSTDTLNGQFQAEIRSSGAYILRLQPELLAGGEYTLEISSGPSLDYPLKTYKSNQIRSFWGDGRDAGARKHEGIDIFSEFRTPVLAVAAGVTRVNENNLGGKVIWLRPEGKDFSVYYAHLDEQIAADGDRVAVGDTIGLMGNTGNARSTPPHLHLGIYGFGGATDPLPYVNPVVKEASGITADLALLNSTIRASRSTKLTGLAGSATADVPASTILNVDAASGNSFRVRLPDGSRGYVAGTSVVGVDKQISRLTLTGVSPLYDQPDSGAAVKRQLPRGEVVRLLGSFKGYRLVADKNDLTGWLDPL